MRHPAGGNNAALAEQIFPHSVAVYCRILCLYVYAVLHIFSSNERYCYFKAHNQRGRSNLRRGEAS